MSLRKTGVNAVTAVVRQWWRLSRGLTLGAQGVVVDGRERVLLVRHRYRPGWFFPGGGVERGETVRSALARELEEEGGVVLTGPPELHGMFCNGSNFPGDHIAVFLVRHWEQPAVPRPNAEIEEQGFFAVGALPRGTEAGTRRRLGEIFGKSPVSETW